MWRSAFLADICLSLQADAEDKHHIARMYDYFICKGHVCIVFELLSVNLYELLKSNAYRCAARRPPRLLLL